MNDNTTYCPKCRALMQEKQLFTGFYYACPMCDVDEKTTDIVVPSQTDNTAKTCNVCACFVDHCLCNIGASADWKSLSYLLKQVRPGTFKEPLEVYYKKHDGRPSESFFIVGWDFYEGIVHFLFDEGDNGYVDSLAFNDRYEWRRA